MGRSPSLGGVDRIVADDLDVIVQLEIPEVVGDMVECIDGIRIIPIRINMWINSEKLSGAVLTEGHADIARRLAAGGADLNADLGLERARP